MADPWGADEFSDLVEGVNYFPSNGYDWSTPPYVPDDYSTAPGASVNPSVLQQVAGSVLNWLVPSAQASPAVIPGVVGAAASGGATVMGRILSAGAGAAGVAAVGARQIGGILATALFKLRGRMLGLSGQTITPAALATWGRKMYAQLASWAAKNPGTSLVALLTGLGLTIEEASHVIAWGATSKRRARSRGVTGAQMRTTRRTISKLSSMARSLSRLHMLTRHGHHHHRRK